MNGQALSQITRGKIVLHSVHPIVGVATGQTWTRKVRYAQTLGISFDLVAIFVVMGFVAHSPPNFAAATIVRYISVASYNREVCQSTACLQGIWFVTARAGPVIRRPMYFWKGLVLAQIIIVVAYLLFGPFRLRIYVPFMEGHRHETFTGIPRAIYTTFSVPGPNVISPISGVIAAGRFSHIASKVVYINFIEGRGGPRLMSSRGRIVWGTVDQY
ncbi:hypothetical protein AX14_008076 [Amanita brunnescens Koide BX004]|nr:hypothetical protein AX14_008076 [Amanita brunnescens Koide BX004]